MFYIEHIKEKVSENMINELTISELLFGLGIYPSLQAVEKFYLFADLMETYFEDEEDLGPLIQSKSIKKLSHTKKASFVSFLENIVLKEEMAYYKQQNIEWIHLFDKKYPKLLKEIYAPPIVLFYQGNIEVLNHLTWLGVVGSRNYTAYGSQAVEHILGPLLQKKKKEIGIVSGLAKGIDTEAHMTTLKNEGATVGVIGSGLDIYYPRKNKELQQFMAQKQLVISEYPLGAKPLKFHFPERNRIIAGLSRGILVIEAKKRSGSLITAYNALDESRDVFAVPGSIFEENRIGNHRLIQLGALLTKSSDDILQEWFYI